MYIIYFKYIWQFCQIAEVTKGVTHHYAPKLLYVQLSDKVYFFLIRIVASLF